jgi:hypothetical protein
MDTYWLRYGYPTRIREGGARGGEEEELRKEGLHGPRAPPRPDPPELGAAELEVGELDAAELAAKACAVPARGCVEERDPRGGGVPRFAPPPPSSAPGPAAASSRGRWRARGPRAPGAAAVEAASYRRGGGEERRRPRVRALPPRPALRGGEGLAEEGRALLAPAQWRRKGRRRSRGGRVTSLLISLLPSSFFYGNFFCLQCGSASRDVGTGGSPESPDALILSG